MNDSGLFLEHYGVKGMKWGVRRKGKVSKSRKSGSQTIYDKPGSKLSSAEMKRRIARMEIEQRYNSLNKQKSSEGKEFAKEIAKGTGRTVAGTLLSGAALYGTKLAIEKKLGAGAATKITRMS